jgi:hypothetical protein
MRSVTGAITPPVPVARPTTPAASPKLPPRNVKASEVCVGMYACTRVTVLSQQHVLAPVQIVTHAPNCVACGRALVPGAVAYRVGEASYHAECFRCQFCEKLLENGRFVNTNGKPVSLLCFVCRALMGSRCRVVVRAANCFVEMNTFFIVNSRFLFVLCGQLPPFVQQIDDRLR